MTTNEVPPIQPLTATVGFTRKTAVGGQYNNNELSLYLPVEIPKLADFDGDAEAYFKQVDDNLRTGFTTAKALVLEQLGLEFEDVNGVIIEKVAAAFGTTAAPAPAQRATAPAAPAASGRTCECGGSEFYDNRAKKASGDYKPNAPDEKCKGCGKGYWDKKKGS